MHDEVRRDCPDEPPKVEDTRQPGILGSLKMEVGLDAEDGGVGEGSLVNILQGPNGVNVGSPD